MYIGVWLYGTRYGMWSMYGVSFGVQGELVALSSVYVMLFMQSCVMISPRYDETWEVFHYTWKALQMSFVAFYIRGWNIMTHFVLEIRWRLHIGDTTPSSNFYFNGWPSICGNISLWQYFHNMRMIKWWKTVHPEEFQSLKSEVYWPVQFSHQTCIGEPTKHACGC